MQAKKVQVLVETELWNKAKSNTKMLQGLAPNHTHFINAALVYYNMIIEASEHGQEPAELWKAYNSLTNTSCG